MAEVHRDQRRLLPREGGLNHFRGLFAGFAAASALGAVGVAIARSQHHFDHGWWLVAYLALVGAAAQALLGLGQLALVQRHAKRVGPQRLSAELVLWNLGVAAVPAGVFTDTTEAIAAGGLSLLVALCLFAAAVEPTGGARGWGYRGLIVFMAGSVFVGTGLGGALPWQ